MYIKSFLTTFLNSYSYILHQKNSKEAVIIDMGEFNDNILNFLQENDLNPVKVLLTHAHIDHIAGLEKLYQYYQPKIYMNSKDIKLYNAINKQAEMFGFEKINNLPNITHFTKDNEKIDILDSVVQVLDTPGHTVGSVCFYIKNKKMLFTGDTLFKGAVGRIDLPGASENPSTIIKSIQNRLYSLEEDTIIYPGHNELTNIKCEKENNTFTLFFPTDKELNSN